MAKKSPKASAAPQLPPQGSCTITVRLTIAERQALDAARARSKEKDWAGRPPTLGHWIRDACLAAAKAAGVEPAEGYGYRTSGRHDRIARGARP